MTDSEYRWNEPGIQTVHAALCTTQETDPTRLAERTIDALKKAGWTPPDTSENEGLVVTKLTIGGLIQPGGMWIGAHYSPAQKRWCLNILPCITLFFVRAGGNLPKRKLKGKGGKFWI